MLSSKRSRTVLITRHEISSKRRKRIRKQEVRRPNPQSWGGFKFLFPFRVRFLSGCLQLRFRKERRWPVPFGTRLGPSRLQAHPEDITTSLLSDYLSPTE